MYVLQKYVAQNIVRRISRILQLAEMRTLAQSSAGMVLATSALESFPTSVSTNLLMSASLSGVICTVIRSVSPSDDVARPISQRE